MVTEDAFSLLVPHLAFPGSPFFCVWGYSCAERAGEVQGLSAAGCVPLWKLLKREERAWKQCCLERIICSANKTEVPASRHALEVNNILSECLHLAVLVIWHIDTCSRS